jgi:hypothetical protein
LNPEKYKAQLEKYKTEKHSVFYYDKEKHNQAMQKYRNKKRLLKIKRKNYR